MIDGGENCQGFRSADIKGRIEDKDGSITGHIVFIVHATLHTISTFVSVCNDVYLPSFTSFPSE